VPHCIVTQPVYCPNTTCPSGRTHLQAQTCHINLVIGGCPSTHASLGIHYGLSRSISTCHSAAKYHHNHVALCIRLSPTGHMHFRHANPGLNAPSKMHAANACCDHQRAMQNGCPDNIKILFYIHHRSCQPHMGRNRCQPAAIQNIWFSLLQFKIDVDLKRDILPQHIDEHAKYT
jgi:hypothetical protein